MEPQPRIIAIIPAYREEASIGSIVGKLRAMGYDVVVIDDNSPDNTSGVARAAGAVVVRHPTNLGYAGGLQTGYFYAVEHGYDAAVQLDADGQHDPNFAPALLAPILSGEADVVIGSRFLAPDSYRVPVARRLGQLLFGAIARIMTGKPVTDPTSGYQALSRKVLAIYCGRLFPDDYPDANMWVLLHRLGLRAKEVPVTMYANERQSMHSGIIKPIYYVCKMSIYLFIAQFKNLSRERQA